MRFSCEQLKEWSVRPASPLPGLTIDIVEAALAGAPQLRSLTTESYVQGSYANETNIVADCDVDIVIQLKMPSTYLAAYILMLPSRL